MRRSSKVDLGFVGDKTNPSASVSGPTKSSLTYEGSQVCESVLDESKWEPWQSLIDKLDSQKTYVWRVQKFVGIRDRLEERGCSQKHST